MNGGKAILTMAAAKSRRKMAILGRYLRLEYSDLMADLKGLELSEGEKEILVALYSGAGGKDISLPQVVDEDSTDVTSMLDRLEENELVVESDSGTRLTPKGQVVVSKHLEDVNT